MLIIYLYFIYFLCHRNSVLFFLDIIPDSNDHHFLIFYTNDASFKIYFFQKYTLILY